jgi:hypothetical protein
VVAAGIDLHPLGYEILIEVLARGRRQRMVEIPHAYEGRHEGTSKLGFRQTVEFLSQLARLVCETRVAKRRCTRPPARPSAFRVSWSPRRRSSTIACGGWSCRMPHVTHNVLG